MTGKRYGGTSIWRKTIVHTRPIDATHADCIAHLSAEYRTRGYPPGKVKNMPELAADFERMRGQYQSLLEENGQSWSEPDGEPIPEPAAVSE